MFVLRCSCSVETLCPGFFYEMRLLDLLGSPFWFHSTRSTCALFYSVREHWPRLDLVAIELGIPCFDQHLHLWMWCGRAVPLTMEAYGISTPSSARPLTSPSGYLQIVHVHVSFLKVWGLAVLARVPSFAESSVDK